MTKAYRDTDNDGVGAGDPIDDVVEDGPPPGYVYRGGDCSPDNPNAYPRAPEVLGDGLDSDCDGIDGWQPQPGWTGSCAPTPLELPPVEMSDCPGSDLYLTVNRCGECGFSRYVIVVSNRGTQLASRVRLLVTREPFALDINSTIEHSDLELGTIESGTNSERVLVSPIGFGQLTFQVVSQNRDAGAECTEDDNVWTTHVVLSECF